MIGTYLFWDRSDPGQQRATALAGALRIETAGPVPERFHGAILCATAGSGRARLADGRALLFDGFIANRRSLRHDLGLTGSDATLYAAARDRWGDAADKHVIGEYAAILVPPAPGPVEMLRSPVQAPALYMWRDADRLIVSSHVQAIFASGEVPRQIDDQKLADTLMLNYCDERRGWFQGVTRVPRASRIEVSRDGMDETVFWRPEDIAPVRFAKDSDYVEALDALFREATADVLDGFSNPAVSLSGGFDSQSVAVYAMAHLPDAPLLSATSVPQPDWVNPRPERMVDESAHVQALAEMYPQLRLNWITSQGADLGHFQREVFDAAMVAPRNGANLHWIHDLRREMRAQGADVLLTGAMGNLTFSYNGTGVVHDALRRGDLSRFLSETWHGGPGWKLGHRMLREGFVPFLPERLRIAFSQWRDGGALSPLESWSPIHPDFARSHNVFDRAVAMGMDPHYLPPRSAADFRHKMMSNAINEAGDISPAIDRLHGLPARDPTAHRKLLEFCFAIPDRQYLDKGRARWLARRLMRGRLPQMVLRERRRGRQAADWFSRIAPERKRLIDEIDWLMSDPDVAGRIDLQRLRQALEQMPAEEGRMSNTQIMALHLALSRGLTTARFIRFINGRNDI